MVFADMHRVCINFSLMCLAMLLTNCVSLKPACPTIPSYPGATAISYVEEEEIVRATTYQAQATSAMIIPFFKQRLEQSGWSLVSEDSTSFSMGYRTTNNQPPFLVSVKINQEGAGMVEYRVGIAIQGPFAWRNWCSTLKP